MAVLSRSDYIKILIFTQYELLFTLLHYCTPVHLCLLAKTHPFIREVVHRFIAHQWDLDKFLSRFVKHTSELRSFMRRTGTVISGSQALQFITSTFYPLSDIDIYVPRYCAKDLLVMMIAEGYHVVGMNPPDAFPSRTRGRPYGSKSEIHSVCTLKRSSNLCMQLIVSRFSALSTFLSFHSTCVMNWITWDRAFCLHAGATLRHLSLLTTWPTSPGEKEAIAKYKARGFSFHEFYSGDIVDVITAGMRAVGDGDCWVLQLSSGLANVCNSTRPFHDTFNDGWMLLADRGRHPHHRYSRVGFGHSAPATCRQDRRFAELEALA